jgi:hypothetical protein
MDGKKRNIMLHVDCMSGLDYIHKERKLVGELKIAFNTDNSSSKNQNIYKLTKFIQQYPGYTEFMDTYTVEMIRVAQKSFIQME